jgi:hypothetical protein
LREGLHIFGNRTFRRKICFQIKKEGYRKGEYTDGGGGELVSMLKVPENGRCVVVKKNYFCNEVKIIHVCYRESEFVIPSLEDRS